MRLLVTTIALLALTACAANSGVVPEGDGMYVVSRQAATGFSGMGTLKADALREAEAFCAKRGQLLHTVKETEAQPPYILGNFPKAEVEFQCLSAGDAAVSRQP